MNNHSKFSEEVIEEIKSLYAAMMSISKICEKLSISKSSVKRILKRNNIEIRPNIYTPVVFTEKKCKYCKLIKPVSDFVSMKIKNVHSEVLRYLYCKDRKCIDSYNNGKRVEAAKRPIKHKTDTDVINEKLYHLTRDMIRKYLKTSVGKIKMCFSMNDLRVDMESKFESWMSWDNFGASNKDKKCWNISHVNFVEFTSTLDDNFNVCWSLSNLKPKPSFEMDGNVIRCRKKKPIDPNRKKTTLCTHEQIEQVKDLYKKKIGTRKIAKEVNIHRDTVKRVCEILGLNVKDRKNERYLPFQKERKCKICSTIKDVSNFRKRQSGDRMYYESYCYPCSKIYSNKKACASIKKRKATDICFRLRSKMSGSIYTCLKRNNSSKKGESSFKYLPYTPQDLKNHLESLFEPWMNWSNWGIFDSKNWNDDDQSTWKWQIDHIIPSSEFKYTDMSDKEFLECWDLPNLRPLSAKQNNMDGVNRTRHEKKLF